VDGTSFQFLYEELDHNLLYVYRAKAIAYKDGQPVVRLFPNGGCSPVCWFTYQSPGGEEETLCAELTRSSGYVESSRRLVRFSSADLRLQSAPSGLGSVIPFQNFPDFYIGFRRSSVHKS
jgi:hypothetical protein